MFKQGEIWHLLNFLLFLPDASCQKPVAIYVLTVEKFCIFNFKLLRCITKIS